MKNRYLHLDYVPSKDENEFQSAKMEIPKCQNDTLDGTLELILDEVEILKRLIENPAITQKELAEELKKSLRTIKRDMAALKEKGYIRRLNGKRNGRWEVLVDVAIGE